MLILCSIVLTLALPQKVSSRQCLPVSDFCFDCHATYQNTAGDLLLDRALAKTKVGVFSLNSWGLSCSMVRPRDVPVILEYLLPRLEANRQKITLTANTLALEPYDYWYDKGRKHL